MLRFLINSFKRLVIAYLCVCLCAGVFQRQLLYHPAVGNQPPQAYGLAGFTDVRLKDADGTQIDGWYHEARTGYPTVVFFHGNAGNIANNQYYFRALADAGFGLLAIDYRGYGASEGTPSEQGFYQDARAAVAYVTGTQHVALRQIVLYGESIGTGVAVQMATEFSAGALVLQSPYTSIEDIAKERFGWLPVHYLLIDRFDSMARIANVHVPLLVMHGEQDITIPVQDGKILFAHANAPKEAVYFPGQGHTDLSIGGRVDALRAFGGRYGLIAHEGKS